MLIITEKCVEFACVVKTCDVHQAVVALKKAEGKRNRKYIAYADYGLWVGGKYVF